MEERLIYEEVKPISKELAEEVFLSQQEDAICKALVSVAFHVPDWRWAQDKFLDFLQDDDPQISGLAATCLGHLARIHHKLELHKVLPALGSRIDDGPDISGRIGDALDEGIIN